MIRGVKLILKWQCQPWVTDVQDWSLQQMATSLLPIVFESPKTKPSMHFCTVSRHQTLMNKPSLYSSVFFQLVCVFHEADNSFFFKYHSCPMSITKCNASSFWCAGDPSLWLIVCRKLDRMIFSAASGWLEEPVITPRHATTIWTTAKPNICTSEQWGLIKHCTYTVSTAQYLLKGP
jgi:hypothetical protein